VATSASYQAWNEGFTKLGYTSSEADGLLRRSIQLAVQAKNDYLNSIKDTRDTHQDSHHVDLPIKLVAASCGTFGASLANGSEYTGDFGNTTVEQIMDFHRKRLQTLLLEDGIDVIAFETIPSLLEATAIERLLRTENFGCPSWISFVGKDHHHVSSGDLMKDCVSLFTNTSSVIAVGCNCCPPDIVEGLLESCKEGLNQSNQLLMCYPNSGEEWKNHEWHSSNLQNETGMDLASIVPRWINKGAKIIGGCCRVTPMDIQAISNIVQSR